MGGIQIVTNQNHCLPQNLGLHKKATMTIKLQNNGNDIGSIQIIKSKLLPSQNLGDKQPSPTSTHGRQPNIQKKFK